MDNKEINNKTLDYCNQRDSKSITKSGMINFVSKLNEMNPENAKEVVKQFPEVADLLKHTTIKYEDIIGKIVESDNKSLEDVYSIDEKILDSIETRRKANSDLQNNFMMSCDKYLSDHDLTVEEACLIFKLKKEVLEDNQIYDQSVNNLEEKIEHMSHEKDTEKRFFNSHLMEVASLAILSVILIPLGTDLKKKFSVT